MESQPAVAVVFHHIGPYHHPWLYAAADRLSVIGIEWSAKAYDSCDAADPSACYEKASFFSERTFEFGVAKKWHSPQLELIYAVPLVKGAAGFF
jgi:hypothetical protein